MPGLLLLARQHRPEDGLKAWLARPLDERPEVHARPRVKQLARLTHLLPKPDVAEGLLALVADCRRRGCGVMGTPVAPICFLGGASPTQGHEQQV